jgi:hypothetical protein
MRLALVLVALAGMGRLVAQEPQVCLPEGAQVYEPGKDGVKPPEAKPFKASRGHDAPAVSGEFTLEVVINDAGTICSAKVIKLSAGADGASAQKFADFFAANNKFKAAMRKGVPVAVRTLVRFSFQKPVFN